MIFKAGHLEICLNISQHENLEKILQKFGGKGQIFPNTLTNSMKNIQIFPDDCESLKFHTNFSFISYADFNQISMTMSQAKEPFSLLPLQLSENI